MADPMISALVRVLIEKLVSETSSSIARYKGIGAEIEKCQNSFKLIEALLTDAYQKEIKSSPVKVWLNDLQHLAYDMEDLLDGWATEAMRREFTHDSEGITSKVRKLIPSCCTNFAPTIKMYHKVAGINAKLEGLLKQKDKYGLSVTEEISRPTNDNRRLQTSVFDPSSIVGRQAQKDALVQQLLLPADEPCHQNYSILPILGMGGVGKTTLAKLVYDEQQVKDHFELKAWICISDEFDVSVRSKEIFIAFGGEVKEEHKNFDKLQQALRDHLTRKRFLLVLDDVRSESPEDWKTLVRPFYTCSPGSKILITTRKDILLRKLGYNSLYKQLESLSDDDALSLFALHALGVRNFDSHLTLKPHGEGIVKKCKNLPLALIALGTLLMTKKDEDSWKGVLESEIWTSPIEGEVIPALRVSYHDLSAPLKRLFAYCSLFPKDFLFDKEDLVLLWMAEGFLQQATPNDSTEEQCLGHKFFDELLSRSFFQHAPNNESLFVMHDLMNDLATSVATEFYLRLDNKSEKRIKNMQLDKYRHMSFVHEECEAYEKLQVLENTTCLRTLLATSVGEVNSWSVPFLSIKIFTDLLPELPLLRVLSLSGLRITNVPESIGTLRHLRYLNLSQSKITHLPQTVGNLYNLQTLILFGCYNLTKLPNSFLKLKNMQHLDVRDTSLSFQMVLEIGELKSLEITLSKIDIKSGTEIAKLKDFKVLRGKISIEGLEKVQNANYADEANFSQKKLSELELVWSDGVHNLQNEMLQKEVLNKLMPCQDELIQLKIRSYGGLKFPKWIGDPSFLRLKQVSISGSKRCTSIPPLGQLPTLKKLLIEGLDGVEVVGFEFFGTGQAFPSLEILSFSYMSGWKKWSGAVFPSLQKLSIVNCSNLVEVTLEAMPSLKDLQLCNCGSGVKSDCPKLDVSFLGDKLTSLKKLEIRRCPGMDASLPGWVWPPNLCILNIGELKKSFSEWGPQNFPTSLVKLELYGGDEDGVIISCSQLSHLLPSSLTSLRISGFQKLESVSARLQHLTSLQHLSFEDCYNLKKVSSHPQHLTSLQHLSFEHCPKMKDLPEMLLPSLLSLYIWGNCPELKERCSSSGSYWPLISHIPYIDIY